VFAVVVVVTLLMLPPNFDPRDTDGALVIKQPNKSKHLGYRFILQLLLQSGD
jgi:hypothetical protein